MSAVWPTFTNGTSYSNTSAFTQIVDRSLIEYRSISGVTAVCGNALRSVTKPLTGE